MIKMTVPKVNTKPYDFMISGYYGSGNFGDDLTLNCLMDHLKEKRGTVLTHDIAKTFVPKNVELIHRFSMKTINRTMKKTKVFLLGSGSILQDTTSFRSFIYYYVITRMAQHHHCKTMLYANGIGPIIRKQNLKRLKKLLKRIDCITVRDQESLDFLHRLGCTGDHVTLTADDSFSFSRENILPIMPPEKALGKTIVGINFKINLELETELQKNIVIALRQLAQRHNLFYYMIPFHYRQDSASLSTLHQKLPEVSLFINDPKDPEQLIQYIASTDFQIFERLHGQILSTVIGIPFIPISYDQKISAFAQQIGIEQLIIEHDKLDINILVDRFEELLSQKDKIKSTLNEYTRHAKISVQKNKENLLKLIEE